MYEVAAILCLRDRHDGEGGEDAEQHAGEGAKSHVSTSLRGRVTRPGGR